MTPSPDVLRVMSPVDGQWIGEVPVTSPEEVETVVHRAREAQRDWQKSSWKDRNRAFRRLAETVYRSREDLAEIITLEQGKTLLESFLLEIYPAVQGVRYLVHHGARILQDQRVGHAEPLFVGRQARYRFRPVGVWAVISPWNYPFVLPFLQVAAAVFAGNAVVLKPSPITPLTGAWIPRLFREAGFPEHLVGLVQGGAREGELLLEHPEIGGVVFTGSVPTGQHVMARAARGIRRVVLELGGNDPALVLGDADVERAARGIAWSAMVNAGQTCASVERVYVERSVSLDFFDALVEAVRAIRVGDPRKPDVDMGPLTVDFQRERVEHHVQDARTQGARVATGGHPLEDLGPLYYAPTVLLDARPDMQVMREETFGPVVAVQVVDGLDEAIRWANASPYGLTASVWTRKRKRAEIVIRELDAGVVTVNSHLYTFAEPESSWGGVKQSGLGRTHGRYGLLAFVDVQYVDAWWSDAHELWWYPYTERLARLSDRFLEALMAPRWWMRLGRLPRFLPDVPWMARHLPLDRVVTRLLRGR